MQLTDSCPETPRIASFLDTPRSLEEQAQLEEHLTNCPQCGEALGDIIGSCDYAKQLQEVGATEVAQEEDSLISQLIQIGKNVYQSQEERNLTAAYPDGEEHEFDLSNILQFWSQVKHIQEPIEFGRYRLLRKLGQGGMGMVVVAEDSQLGRTVALKILAPQILSLPGARERFLQEARANATIQHENVVTVHDVGEENNIPFFTMEHLRGETLQDRLTREERLEIDESIRVAQEIAAGLQASQEKSVTHHDIKPGNLWVEAKTHRIKILDFGLARPAEPSHLTQQGHILGTPPFMAPEQIGGERGDHRSDLYSLGAVLYTCLTGNPPFEGETTHSLLTATLNSTPVPPRKIDSRIPKWLSGLTMDLLAKEPIDRPQSSEEVLDRLNQIETTHNQIPDNSNSNTLWMIITLAALILGTLGWLGAKAIFLDKDDTSERTNPQPQIVPWRTQLISEPTKIRGVNNWTLETQGHRGVVNTVAYSRDGKFLASGGEDGSIRIWDVKTGDLLKILITPELWGIKKIVWSRDGTMLACCGYPIQTGVTIWNAKMGKLLHSSTVAADTFDWIGDSPQLAIGLDKTISLWNIESKKVINKFSCPDGINLLAVSSNGQSLIATHNQSSIFYHYDLKTGGQPTVYQGHQGAIRTMVWNHKGTQLATGSRDKTIRIWNIGAKQNPQVVTFPNEVLSIAWSPKAKLELVCAYVGGLQRIDLNSGKVLREFPYNHVGHTQCVDWSSDGETIATGEGDCKVRILNAKSGKESYSIQGHQFDFRSTVWSSERNLMLACLKKYGHLEGIGLSWNPKVQKDSPVFRFKKDNPTQLAFSPDGTHLAKANYFEGFTHLEVMDISTRKVLSTKKHNEEISVLRWSTDGKLLALGDWKGGILIWNPRGGKESRKLQSYASAVSQLDWTPDNRQLLTASSHDSNIRLYNVQTGKVDLELANPDKGRQFQAIALSPDGKSIIASSHSSLVLWNTTTGQHKDRFVSQSTGNHYLTWLTNDQFLTWGSDGMLRTWSVDRGEVIRNVRLVPPSWPCVAVQKGIGTFSRLNASTLVELQSGIRHGTLLALHPGKPLIIGASGHYRGASVINRELRYVAETSQGLETFTIEEFAKRFGWKNDPSQAVLIR